MKNAIISSLFWASCFALPVEDHFQLGDALLGVSVDANVGLEARDPFYLKSSQTTQATSSTTSARTSTSTTTTRTTVSTTTSTRSSTTSTSTRSSTTSTSTRPSTTTTSTTSRATTTSVVVPTTTTTRASTSSTSSTTSAAPASNTGNSDGSAAYINPIIVQHNLHRVNHSASNIVWDNGLAATAQKIAASCVYAHDTSTDGGGYGQNIGAGYTPSQVPGMITNGMYNGEMPFYPGYGSEPDMSTFGKWGHFTQIVWKGTSKVGCYTQYCPNGLQNTGSGIRPYFTVCNYSPAGNYVGQFNANVGAPLGNPTVYV